ncbi:MAG: hypothetical protein R3248_04785 [Candidatus Promineifilaceae bacterium]|nr:hypothetical protein [Candidatus Promineifilaceae bacterium]
MLKKRVAILVFVSCLLAAFAFVLGTLPTEAAGTGIVESVTGSTHMTVPLSVFDPSLEGDAVMRTLSYNALRHADGRVSGQYEYQLVVQGEDDFFHGTIICFKAEGNRAWIGATVDSTSVPPLEGLYSWWQVEDNGQGANASPDRTTFLGFGSLAETIEYCEGPAPRFIFEIEGGDVQVRDEG